MVEVIVSRLGLDSASNAFVVILQEKNGTRILPIWIGRTEAESIAVHLDGVERARPMTHDLATSLITTLGGTLKLVYISRVHEGTFYAEMHVVSQGETHLVDARPSDSIAIALRCGAPLFAAEELLADTQIPDEGDGEAAGEHAAEPEFGSETLDAHMRSVEELQRYLAQLRPEDFGKFKP
ncbi:MAG TPA: bifunctional nuclease family protein [Gemmatimonadaceae bacterium]|nr:bifunctional nuclease family protein [Gemmatimonadaceae bacterium]